MRWQASDPKSPGRHPKGAGRFKGRLKRDRAYHGLPIMSRADLLGVVIAYLLLFGVLAAIFVWFVA
jgi:hypothetical protein